MVAFRRCLRSPSHAGDARETAGRRGVLFDSGYPRLGVAGNHRDGSKAGWARWSDAFERWIPDCGIVLSVSTPEILLRADSLDVRYGASRALFDVSLDIPAGQVVALLGPNGAGKSTFARALSGLVPLTSGSIQFNGLNISKMPAHRRQNVGLTYIPEGRGIFPGLSVIDNLRMAARRAGGRSEREAAVARAIELFPILGSRSRQRAGSLSGGEQQMLSLGRALAVEPKLLIADEMSLGLAPIVVEAVFQSLEQVRDAGISVLLIEQFVHRALKLANQCVILSRGRVGWSGPASDAGAEVLDRYLGDAESVAAG
jgi:branched-chain amino acid transport system ATP-binding protein